MIITYQKLHKHWACRSQLAVFHKEWPQGAKVTLKNCIRASELNLDIYFVARHFLTRTACNKFMIYRNQAYLDYSLALSCAVDNNPHQARSILRQPLFKVYLQKMSHMLYITLKEHPKHEGKRSKKTP